MRRGGVGGGLRACGAGCGAGLGVRAASEAEGGSVGTWKGREDGFVCVQGGEMPGGRGGGVL